ncbi:MAG TPA: glycosyltransferase family 39 protein [Steroidobacteraceae bacterium]|jgi:4-amino-4-deoxy-L-arabinose transferase-like glycosyltransferase
MTTEFQAAPVKLLTRHALMLRVLLALAIFALCWRLGGHALLEPDEGRNVEVAREMARGGDWVLPHLNGLPYLDKPAPYFAGVALSLTLFGESESSARLASLLFTVGSVALVFRLGRRIGPPLTGELSALALATMPLVLAFSRTVIFDPALACLVTLALYAAWRALEPDTAQRTRWAALTWATLGVATITKGPVAVLVPLLVLAGFAAAARTSLKPLFCITAWPWFFVTGLPWFIAVTMRRPDFPRYAFIDESLQRIATDAAGRSGPLWYFVPVALAGSLPWSFPALAAALGVWQRRTERREPIARPVVFLVAWAIVPLVFFSLSQSKLPGYYLPALPAWALGAGLLLARAATDQDAMGRAVRAARGAGITLLLLAVLLIVASYVPASQRTFLRPMRATFPSFALVYGGLLAVAGALALIAVSRRRVDLMAMAFALPVMTLPIIGAPLFHAFGLQRSSIELAAAIDSAAPGAHVVGAGTYPTSLRYYLDRPVWLATETGKEMTSNYVVSRLAEFRALPDSPLRPGDWWRAALDACTAPTVFVTMAGTPQDSALAARLPLIATGGTNGRYVARGPCSSPGSGGTAGTPAPATTRP